MYTNRDFFIEHINKQDKAICVEIGVLRGDFTNHLLAKTSLHKMYAVDIDILPQVRKLLGRYPTKDC